MLDLHTTEHRYDEVQPPLMVYDDVMYGTGQLPKFEDDLFRTESRPSLEFGTATGAAAAWTICWSIGR